ncbi:hypothetical protein FA95DRAFT_1223565 [Auriscalpium vulgare]|uniref:Uncharacterized protein n=1 Tax=Auriscalpium vulgare TaxID=40419 RepID=A0ACB8R3H2_9AGAM|nr:hypothetical protein FA95DRAFT_1223565 [Auriscalpium vulgare]
MESASGTRCDRRPRHSCRAVNIEQPGWKRANTHRGMHSYHLIFRLVCLALCRCRAHCIAATDSESSGASSGSARSENAMIARVDARTETQHICVDIQLVLRPTSTSNASEILDARVSLPGKHGRGSGYAGCSWHREACLDGRVDGAVINGRVGWSCGTGREGGVRGYRAGSANPATRGCQDLLEREMTMTHRDTRPTDSSSDCPRQQINVCLNAGITD